MKTPSFLVPYLLFLCLCGFVGRAVFAETGAVGIVNTSLDPVTRFVHVAYSVPADAPEAVDVVCTWATPDSAQWRPASVTPLISETAMMLVREPEWKAWKVQGRVEERRAAGLERTVVFHPYPEAQRDGVIDVDFRVQVLRTDGTRIGEAQTRVQADNRDVVYVEEWGNILQHDALGVPDTHRWQARSGQENVSLNNDLYGPAEPQLPLPPLSYPLDLRGWYAVFICTDPAQGAIRLRFTGDERSDGVASQSAKEEVLWRWAKTDRQHLVLTQPHDYTGCVPAHIDYVKLVPLDGATVSRLDAQFGGGADKIIAGYWEPYSWAFHDQVENTLQHREALSVYQEARIPIVDTQIGRFGMKVVYESRMTDPLYYSTIGDAVAGDARPLTDNVGRMQQYTNTLDATIRYTREFGLRAHANFGASNCYPGSPLQGDFSKQHPEWMRGSALRFEVPEVRKYALALYREALEIGAPGLSLDFCRYPETIDTVVTCNTFLSALRALADEFSTQEGGRVPILVRFPGSGVRLAELFDYATWAREGWVDYLCPSNIQGRHLHIDMAPYIEALKGADCTLLPCVDALIWGLDFPGPFLWRVAQLYEQGVPGLYIYQADGRLFGRPEERRVMRMLSSSEAVRRFWDEDATLRPRRSKGIYPNRPRDPGPEYHGWERVRIWVEGVPFGEMETYLDGQLVSKMSGPPYVLGTEEYASDGVIPKGEHTLRVRVRDGDGWLEQEFTVLGKG